MVPGVGLDQRGYRGETALQLGAMIKRAAADKPFFDDIHRFKRLTKCSLWSQFVRCYSNMFNGLEFHRCQPPKPCAPLAQMLVAQGRPQ